MEKKKSSIPSRDRSIDLYVPITLEEAYERLMTLQEHRGSYDYWQTLDIETAKVDDDTYRFTINGKQLARKTIVDELLQLIHPDRIHSRTHIQPNLHGFIKRWKTGTVRFFASGYIPRRQFLKGMIGVVLFSLLLTLLLVSIVNNSGNPDLPSPVMLSFACLSIGFVGGALSLAISSTSGERELLKLLERNVTESRSSTEV